jgi:hypothetical protein
MATYKTAPRVDYDASFQSVAQRLFDLTSNRLVHGLAVAEKGSYSWHVNEGHCEQCLAYHRQAEKELRMMKFLRDSKLLS